MLCSLGSKTKAINKIKSEGKKREKGKEKNQTGLCGRRAKNFSHKEYLLK